MTSYSLNYHFVAEFDDGSVIEQTPDDISVLDPKKSEFYDVLQAKKTLKWFSLVGDRTYSLDLETGTFEINGSAFIVGDQIDTKDSLELIYYKQVRRHQNITVDTKTGQELDRQDAGMDITWILGFKVKNSKGELVERKIGFE